MNKERRGDLVFWSVSDMKTTKEVLEDLGFEDFVPRNDFKTSLIKALKIATKGNDKLYRRYGDVPGEVNFAVFEQEVTGDDIHLSKEHVLRLDKTHGNLHWKTQPDAFQERITRDYKDAKDTIDSQQFRALILKVVKQEMFGISMRPGGGIYFLDRAFDHKRDSLTKLFEPFKKEASLHVVPIYGDESTLNAIEEAASTDIFGDIEELMKDIDRRFKAGAITRRQLEGDKDKARRIMTKIETHEKNLRSEHLKVASRLQKLSNGLVALTERVEGGIVEPGDFMDFLKHL